MDIKEFVKKEARENLAREFTKEGLFELKEQKYEAIIIMSLQISLKHSEIIFSSP